MIAMNSEPNYMLIGCSKKRGIPMTSNRGRHYNQEKRPLEQLQDRKPEPGSSFSDGCSIVELVIIRITGIILLAWICYRVILHHAS